MNYPRKRSRSGRGAVLYDPLRSSRPGLNLHNTTAGPGSVQTFSSESSLVGTGTRKSLISTPHGADMSELRLVVLGRSEARTASAVCSILGLNDPQQDEHAAAAVLECSKQRGEAAGRQVVLVSGPDWLGLGCDPEDRRSHISSFIASSSPGPHAFLLCVPVNQPSDGEAEALDALAELFGPRAVSSNTVVLFTHTEELEEDERLEEYMVTWRKDLLELVKRCGNRYHTLETRGGAPGEEAKAVEELLEKVEQAVAESGTPHFTCALYQEAEERVRERQLTMVMERRGEEPEENVTEEEMVAVRDEAERSVGDLNVDVDRIFPPAAVSHPPPSFLWSLWERLMGWTRWLPRMVRREALLGALVGLFVGGPVGGMMGATVGSVATEVARRRTQKTK